MSYCRGNGIDSDLYIIGTLRSDINILECLCCDLMKDKHSFFATTRSEMILHMFQHQRAGHKVLERAIRRLLEEILTYGDVGYD